MKKQILAEEVDQIIQQSFWGKGGIKLTESVQEPQAQETSQDEEVSDDQQVVEGVETHVCPLCESHLEEAISDEQLAEHVDFMVGIINEMEDISDDDLTELAEELVSDEDNQEELAEAEEKKKPEFLKRIMKGKKG